MQSVGVEQPDAQAPHVVRRFESENTRFYCYGQERAEQCSDEDRPSFSSPLWCFRRTAFEGGHQLIPPPFATSKGQFASGFMRGSIELVFKLIQHDIAQSGVDVNLGYVVPDRANLPVGTG